MKESIETGIRLKAILIYIVVAVVCCGMIIYVYNLRQNIDDRRIAIEHYQHTLSLTNQLVDAVSQAQTEANLYLTTKQEDHLRLYKQETTEVELLASSFNVGNAQDNILEEISTLLHKKGGIVAELNKLFSNQNAIDSINKRSHGIVHTLLSDSLMMTTTIKDTVVHRIPKKGFWKRLGEVFSPGNKPDSIVKVITRKIDTVKLPEKTNDTAPDMKDLVAETGKNYTNHISDIEKQVSSLILVDQEISLQITRLLNQLSSRTINSTLAEIQTSSQLIRRNYTYSIVGSGISLVLILLFILLIINDVNKGKAARKALEQANARTLQVVESRHQLLLSVSHDIKTPLGSILGYLELWQKENVVPQKQLSSMQNSGKHILSLLENLLEFSSLEQGTLVANNSHFNLWNLCTETAGMFTPLALQKSLSFDCDFTLNKDTEVLADALKIKQIIINILSNAVKYTSNGSIQFKVAYADNKLCCSISDTGAGIPASQMDALFKPFARIDRNSALAPGSGLGMYVVKGLVELLHGTIEVASTEGEGTRIEVTIPVNIITEKRHPMVVAPKRILLVDDDPALLAMFRDMLAKLGYIAGICNNPIEFDPQDETTVGYDMVITDMEMGNVTGTGILRKIRHAGQHVTVIVMTGRSDFNETKALQAGFDGFLPKPVTLQALSQLTGHPVRHAGEFASLEEMFDGDRQAIAEVLEVFAITTTNNIRTLHEAVAGNDFGKVQATCHKMLPMFMQVGASADSIEFLQLMDAARNDKPDQHPYWRGKTVDFIGHAEKLMKKIRKDYLSSD